MPRIVVACIGAGLAGDCLAGSAIHGLLSGCTLPEGCRLVLVPAAPVRLLAALDGAEAVVAVGEVELGARPGTIHLLDWREVPFGGDGGARSGHGLRLAMEAARIRDPALAPRRAYLVGVEGRGFGGHAGVMHAEVAASIAGATRIVVDLVQGLAELDVPGDVELSLPARRAIPSPPPQPAAGR